MQKIAKSVQPTLSRVNFSGYVGQVTIFSCILTTVSCLVVGLGLGLFLVSGWKVVMHTYLNYFPLSLSLSLGGHGVHLRFFCG